VRVLASVSRHLRGFFAFFDTLKISFEISKLYVPVYSVGSTEANTEAKLRLEITITPADVEDFIPCV